MVMRYGIPLNLDDDLFDVINQDDKIAIKAFPKRRKSDMQPKMLNEIASPLASEHQQDKCVAEQIQSIDDPKETNIPSTITIIDGI